MIEDTIIICKACHCEFVFTGSEQRFYASRDLAPPKRCRDCREKRKAELAGRADEASPRSRVDRRRGSR